MFAFCFHVSCSRCAVDVKNQVASIDRMSNVEDGIEVGQDNLGMDSVDEESVATKEKHSGIIFNLNFNGMKRNLPEI